MKEIRTVRKGSLKGKRGRRLHFKQLFAKLKTLAPSETRAKPLTKIIEKEKVKGTVKGRRKIKNKYRKRKPKLALDNFGRFIYIPRNIRKRPKRLKVNHAYVGWLENRQRKQLNYARLDIRFSGRRRRFHYDPNFKPKRFYKKNKPSKGLEFISKEDWDSEKRDETYGSYIKKYRDQKFEFESKKRKRILKRLRSESRMLKTFLGALIRRGKKSKAIKIFRSLVRLISLSKFYKSRKIKKKNKKSPMRFIFRAVVLASPRIMLKSKRVGGIIYRLPIFIDGSRRTHSLGMRWIVASAQKRPEKFMAERLANEIIDIHRKKGLTIKRKAEVYKVGVGNKAFVHYMWRKKKRRKKALKKINRR